MFDFEDEYDESVNAFSDYAFEGLPRAQPILEEATEQGSINTTINTGGSIQ